LFLPLAGVGEFGKHCTDGEKPDIAIADPVVLMRVMGKQYSLCHEIWENNKNDYRRDWLGGGEPHTHTHTVLHFGRALL
jgi:hypothetical protein